MITEGAEAEEDDAEGEADAMEGSAAATAAGDDESTPSGSSRTTSGARTSSHTSSEGAGIAAPAGQGDGAEAAKVQEALSPQLTAQSRPQRGVTARDGMNSTELAAHEVAQEISAAKRSRVAARRREDGKENAAPPSDMGSSSPSSWLRSSQSGSFDTLEKAVPITTFNTMQPTTRGPIHHTLTVTAQNRLVECDALCSSIIRGVRSDDESNPGPCPTAQHRAQASTDPSPYPQ